MNPDDAMWWVTDEGQRTATQPPPPRHEIVLTCGRVAWIDAADLPLISGYKLYADVRKNLIYVRCRRGPTRVYLHKLITGFQRTDHRNGDGLDNRRINLRSCTHAENIRNSRRRSDVDKKYRGAFWHGVARKWMTQIRFNNRIIYGGLFEREEDAAQAYDDLAKKYHGAFARLNFPEANV